MAIVYQVFSNDGAGGPIDYSTVVATVYGASHTTVTLAPSGDYRFGVRAMDTATGLAEANTQASVRIALDAAGNDIGQVPNAPFAATARATSGGGCLVSWSYFAAGYAAAPTNFLVYLTAGTSPSLSTPAATIAYQPGVVGYSCQLDGLLDAMTYTVSVVSRGAGASASSVASSATVIGDVTPPGDIEALTAVAIP
jgi:hypothetical protein